MRRDRAHNLEITGIGGWRALAAERWSRHFCSGRCYECERDSEREQMCFHAEPRPCKLRRRTASGGSRLLETAHYYIRPIVSAMHSNEGNTARAVAQDQTHCIFVICKTHRQNKDETRWLSSCSSGRRTRRRRGGRGPGARKRCCGAQGRRRDR